MTKYQNISDLCDQMTQNRVAKRPNCENILNSESLSKWTFEHDFDVSKEYEKVLRYARDNSSFIYKLLKYKTFTNEVIPVNSGQEIKKLENIYPMTRNPRGRCLIINNIVDENIEKNLMKDTGLYKESKRFESIFRQLYFDVQPIDSTIAMSANAIRDRLRSTSKDKSLFEDEALVVMIISHGRDEQILGFDACQGRDCRDVIKVSEIVDIFSENECIALKQKPKIFLFNCYRNSM